VFSLGVFSLGHPETIPFTEQRTVFFEQRPFGSTSGSDGGMSGMPKTQPPPGSLRVRAAACAASLLESARYAVRVDSLLSPWMAA